MNGPYRFNSTDEIWHYRRQCHQLYLSDVIASGTTWCVVTGVLSDVDSGGGGSSPHHKLFPPFLPPQQVQETPGSVGLQGITQNVIKPSSKWA